MHHNKLCHHYVNLPMTSSVEFSPMRSSATISVGVGGGRTSNIHEHHTTFLGSIVAHSSRHTTKIASQLFLEAFTSSLKKLDQTVIRREYKVWIYKRYLVPSYHFKLAVNAISSSTIKKPMLLQQSVLNPGLGFLVQLRWQYYITLQFLIFHFWNLTLLQLNFPIYQP